MAPKVRARAAIPILAIVAACGGSSAEFLGGPDDGGSSSSSTSGGSSSGNSTSSSGGSSGSSASSASSSGGSSGSSTSSSTSSSSGTSGQDGGGRDASDGATCSTPPGPFPDFPNGCTGNDACSIGFHLPQCCGNWAAIGINRNAQTTFDKTEQQWESGCSGCACPTSGLATAQDGQTGVKQNVHVQCKLGAGSLTGTCVTYFP